MTLNGVMAVILRYFNEIQVASGAHCVKVVEDIPKLSATEISLKLLVFSDISLTMI